MHTINKKNDKAYNFTICLIFLVIITLPLLGIRLHKADPYEQRALTAFPRQSLARHEIKLFLHDFEAYFNDHFGFRSFFLNLYHRTLYFVLKKSGSEHVMIGKKGWLFYTEDKSFEDLQGREHFSLEEKKKWAATIQERAAWLASQGITYRFVIAPDKHSVYSEYLPSYFHNHKPSRLDGLMAYIGNDPYVVNLLPVLLTAKKRAGDKLYFHTDTHWTSYGAYIGFGAIMESLGEEYLKNAIAINHNDFKKYPQGQERDLSNMARLRLKESDWLSLTLSPNFREEKATLPENFPAYIRFSATYNPDKSKTLLIIHDSFTMLLTSYLSSSFKRVIYFFGIPNNEQFIQLVLREKPDVVIEERVERFMQVTPTPELSSSLAKLS